MTDAPSLADWLLERIADDEAVARAAIEDDGGSDAGFSGKYEEMIRPPSGIGIAQGGFGEAAARMIATYAVPARVLARCEVDRRIVEDFIAATDADGAYDDGYEDGYRCALERACEALASVYADAPGWREEWR